MNSGRELVTSNLTKFEEHIKQFNHLVGTSFRGCHITGIKKVRKGYAKIATTGIVGIKIVWDGNFTREDEGDIKKFDRNKENYHSFHEKVIQNYQVVANTKSTDGCGLLKHIFELTIEECKCGVYGTLCGVLRYKGDGDSNLQMVATAKVSEKEFSLAVRQRRFIKKMSRFEDEGLDTVMDVWTYCLKKNHKKLKLFIYEHPCVVPKDCLTFGENNFLHYLAEGGDPNYSLTPNQYDRIIKMELNHPLLLTRRRLFSKKFKNPSVDEDLNCIGGNINNYKKFFNARNSDNKTPLIIALEGENTSLAAVFITNKCIQNPPGPNDDHYKFISERKEEIEESLLKPDESGSSPIYSCSDVMLNWLVSLGLLSKFIQHTPVLLSSIFIFIQLLITDLDDDCFNSPFLPYSFLFSISIILLEAYAVISRCFTNNLIYHALSLICTFFSIFFLFQMNIVLFLLELIFVSREEEWWHFYIVMVIWWSCFFCMYKIPFDFKNAKFLVRTMVLKNIPILIFFSIFFILMEISWIYSLLFFFSPE